jgi:hypothetical protein
MVKHRRALILIEHRSRTQSPHVEVFPVPYIASAHHPASGPFLDLRV